MSYSERVRNLAARLEEAGADALLVTNLTNVRYLTGFSGTNGQVLVAPNSVVFFSDPRYEARAKDLVEGAEVVIYPARLTDALNDRLKGVARLGIEASTMTLAERDDLDERIEGAELVPTKGLVEDLRREKDDAEVRALEAAIAIGDRAFEWILDRIVPGAVERDLALELEIEMRRNGADGVSFDPIVGSGPLSAHIHHTASDREFAKGDLVLLDFGCRLDGYCSDLTRTVALGSAPDDVHELYALVLSAQKAGIEAVGAEVRGADADAAARALIDSAGYGDRFGHGLGHGVGLDIHEAPRLHRISDDVLRTGDVVTVEPGVYLPGRGGIRIEDCVVVTQDGARVLGNAPKDSLIEL